MVFSKNRKRLRKGVYYAKAFIIIQTNMFFPGSKARIVQVIAEQ